MSVVLQALGSIQAKRKEIALLEEIRRPLYPVAGTEVHYSYTFPLDEPAIGPYAKTLVEGYPPWVQRLTISYPSDGEAGITLLKSHPQSSAKAKEYYRDRVGLMIRTGSALFPRRDVIAEMAAHYALAYCNLFVEFYEEDPSRMLSTMPADEARQAAGAVLYVGGERIRAFDYFPDDRQVLMRSADTIRYGESSTFRRIRATTDWKGVFVVMRLDSSGVTTFDAEKDALVHSFAKSIELQRLEFRFADGRLAIIAQNDFRKMKCVDGSAVYVYRIPSDDKGFEKFFHASW